MENYIKKAAVLLEALPYIQNFRDSVVVIKFGGSVLEDKELSDKTLRDIVFMECIGIKPIIVHGGGKAISAKLEEEKIPVKFINGQRYTCEKTISIVDDVLHNEVNHHILKTINAYGGNAVKVSGKDIFKAKKLYSANSADDLGLVGEVHKMNTAKLNSVLKKNAIPVITPLSFGNDNKLYNINADIAAAKVAELIQARKLVYISDVPGILKDIEDDSSLISTMYLKEVQDYIDCGIISGGMIPKINSAVKALNAGTNKVHLVDGRLQHSLLLEIFTETGVGTQILKEHSNLNVYQKHNI
ncbi:MAG TPA: acetylglutamate kinase [Victivallales bacterium]|nr:acetylglutamate kinase [Victivallales bacterium]